MQKVRIKLGLSMPFWFMKDLRLDDENLEKTIDLDELQPAEIETINRSLKNNRVKVFDLDGEELSEVSVGVRVATIDINMEDLPEEELESFSPEVISATVPIEEEEDEIEVIEAVVTEQLLDEASRIVNKNANTVKKIIRGMGPDTVDIKLLLEAVCEVEKSFKNRSGILKEAQDKLTEINNG